MKIKSLSANLGAEVIGLDAALPLDQDQLQEIQAAFARYHLLVFREQQLNEDQLVHFSRYFAEPVESLHPTFKIPTHPVITKYSNMVGDDAEAIGAMAPEMIWHSDSYFTDNPNKATIFYSLISPEEGGETHFINMCAAYADLDEATQQEIANYKAYYKNAFIKRPPVLHPLVRLSTTGEKALFVNSHRALGIDGIDADIGLALLNRLYQHSIEPKRVYQHKWQDGDLAVWNNPTTMHCATTIAANQQRMLYRILTKGSLPVT